MRRASNNNGRLKQLYHLTRQHLNYTLMDKRTCSQKAVTSVSRDDHKHFFHNFKGAKN